MGKGKKQNKENNDRKEPVHTSVLLIPLGTLKNRKEITAAYTLLYWCQIHC